MTTINRRLLFQGGLALGAVTALAACGDDKAGSTSSSAAPSSSASASGAADAGAITVWVDANRQPVIKAVAAQFKKDTGVTVNLVVKDFGKIADDFINQVPTGKGPDATVIAHDGTGRCVQNGVIAPLELGDASVFQEVAVKGFTYEGKVYGVPYAIENIALLRNIELAPEAPKDWNALLAAGKAAKTKYPVLVGLDPKGADPYHLYPLQMSYGAPVFKQNSDGGYDGKQLAMGGANGAKFAQFLSDMGKQKVFSMSISGDIALDQFNKKQSPFFITGPWNLDAIKKAGIKYAIDPIPAAGPDKAIPFVSVQGFVMSSKAQNAVATQKFLVEYIGSDKVQTELFKVGLRAPANKAAFQAAKSDKDVAGFGAVGAQAVPMPNVPAMGAVWTDWGIAEAQIIGGQATDPAGTWQKMVDTINGKIKK